MCNCEECRTGTDVLAKPDTTPLYIQMGATRAVVQDKVQRRLDAARAEYRKRYDYGYLLSQKGQDILAQRILNDANAALRAAEEEYAEARRERRVG